MVGDSSGIVTGETMGSGVDGIIGRVGMMLGTIMGIAGITGEDGNIVGDGVTEGGILGGTVGASGSSA